MTRYEKSCGAIIFKQQDSQPLYLTVEYKKEAGYWGLVKGHVETGETELETARREIHEEVGLSELTFWDDFRVEIEYNPQPDIQKQVIFFLAETHTDAVQYLWGEHTNHQWLPYPEVLQQLKYNTDRKVITQAHKFLTQHPDSAVL